MELLVSKMLQCYRHCPWMSNQVNLSKFWTWPTLTGSPYLQLDVKQAQSTCMTVGKNTSRTETRARHITTFHRAEHNWDQIHECANPVWQFRLRIICIAFATSLCEGIDPTTCIYRQPSMRRHFLACIDNGEMKAFPTARIRRRVTNPVKIDEITVYCTCRMPFNEQEAGKTMIMCYKCREWFHDTCLVKPVSEQYWIPKNKTKWYCTYCEQKYL